MMNMRVSTRIKARNGIALLLTILCCSCGHSAQAPEEPLNPVELPGPAQPADPEDPASSTEAPVYILRDLGTLGGVASSAKDINNYGDIVGWANIADGKRRAFLYREGGMIELGTLVGGSCSEATAISDNGQVVGFSGINAHGPQFREFIHGFLWQAGTIRALQPQYCPCSFNSRHGTSTAYGINKSGQAVGWTGTVRGEWVIHAARWQSPYESIGEDIGAGAGAGDWEISRAFGINDSGQVVGDYAPEGGSLGIHERRAFLWNNGTRQDLGALPGHIASTALAINPAGMIIGWSGSVDATTARAFLWRDGSMQDLGTLPGDTNSQARGINASVQVVGWSGTVVGMDVSSEVGGWSEISDPASARAFLWQHGQMLDLNALTVLDANGVPAAVSGWMFAEAAAINDAGQIVGTGFRNGEMRGFLLNPAP